MLFYPCWLHCDGASSPGAANQSASGVIQRTIQSKNRKMLKLELIDRVRPGVLLLILAAGVGIDAAGERDVVREQLQRHQVDERSEPDRCFRKDDDVLGG